MDGETCGVSNHFFCLFWMCFLLLNSDATVSTLTRKPYVGEHACLRSPHDHHHDPALSLLLQSRHRYSQGLKG
jgi:hypothetical protein